jgi:3-phenylpropionate/cinnamic acid dioxygenase small subunit
VDDRAAITALIHEYAERLDAGDLDGVAALFEHASWGSPGRGEPLRGAAAVRRGYDGVIIHENGTPETKHVISNVTVELDEPAATASARSYFTVLQARPDLPLQTIIAGRYHDRFERDDDERWRFTERIIITDLVGDLSRHLRDPGEAQRA